MRFLKTYRDENAVIFAADDRWKLVVTIWGGASGEKEILC